MTPDHAIRLGRCLWTTTARERLVVWQVFESALFWPNPQSWLGELGLLLERKAVWLDGDRATIAELQEEVVQALERRVGAAEKDLTDTGDLFNHQQER